MSDNPNVAAGEYASQVEAGVEVVLSQRLRRLRDHVTGAFDEVEAFAFRGELTLVVPAGRIVDVLRFCRDDPEVGCELLADLSGVHWPGGTFVTNEQETTGWPAFPREQEGRIELDYVLRSVRHNHMFRLRVNLPDEGARLPTATNVYRAANVMEREAYDFFGVVFDGHPNMSRILMPDDWVGHPHRKDYPLGGVDVEYKGASIPPPDQRVY